MSTTAGLDAIEIVAGLTFGRVREYVLTSVQDMLPAHGEQQWRTMAAGELAEVITTRIMAGIAPVIGDVAVRTGIGAARSVMDDDNWLAANGYQRKS
jgi:hypothetical protein